MTCPHKYLHHDSCLLLKTSMSVHGNQGEFLLLCRGQKIRSPLSCFSSALRVPTVAAQQALISGDMCMGTRAPPHPSSDELESTRLYWEELQVTALCLLKCGGQLISQVGALVLKVTSVLRGQVWCQSPLGKLGLAPTQPRPAPWDAAHPGKGGFRKKKR